MLECFLENMRRSGRGLTLIELVIVLAIVGLLVALAVPRYLGGRKRAYKAQAFHILLEAKSLSWAFYQDRGPFTGITLAALEAFTVEARPGLTMPSGSAWQAPTATITATTVRWTLRGQASGFPLTTSDQCSINLSSTGRSSRGCTF